MLPLHLRVSQSSKAEEETEEEAAAPAQGGVE